MSGLFETSKEYLPPCTHTITMTLHGWVFENKDTPGDDVQVDAELVIDESKIDKAIAKAANHHTGTAEYANGAIIVKARIKK